MKIGNVQNSDFGFVIFKFVSFDVWDDQAARHDVRTAARLCRSWDPCREGERRGACASAMTGWVAIAKKDMFSCSLAYIPVLRVITECKYYSALGVLTF